MLDIITVAAAGGGVIERQWSQSPVQPANNVVEAWTSTGLRLPTTAHHRVYLLGRLRTRLYSQTAAWLSHAVSIVQWAHVILKSVPFRVGNLDQHLIQGSLVPHESVPSNSLFLPYWLHHQHHRHHHHHFNLSEKHQTSSKRLATQTECSRAQRHALTAALSW